MTKGQLIEEIRAFNPTASAQFLEQFEADALKQYLDHLKAAQAKQIRIHGWNRKRENQKMAS